MTKIKAPNLNKLTLRPWHCPVEGLWPSLINGLTVDEAIREPDLPAKRTCDGAEHLVGGHHHLLQNDGGNCQPDFLTE